ncbi:MAG TPA: PH domain-containing protein [Flavobacterium sp.]|uniref:PH domain-containing protein n=1 Tax=Flavobacterium sp. TaxID=239 RepID=UPI002C92D605|nr:PH domain-containing protein [Flavobacterium sp.]HSD14991.1 PH domain-containing protein [Flavobacterium sp.]
MNFTNETINITKLPKFEEVSFLPLHKEYQKIILISNFIFLLVMCLMVGLFLFFAEEARNYWYLLVTGVLVLFLISTILGKISFKKRGYAFRQHDVLYKSGIISETTTIIPYSRIQHVALHEGFIARQFGLASIQIFTAGGGNSDIEIPGIEKDQAQNIKQLLMTKLTAEIANNVVENE